MKKTIKKINKELEAAPDKKLKGLYLLPNLLTTSALFAGFYAIMAAMSAEFSAAAIAIFIAFIFDGLDGRIARLTGTQSDFGSQYDSLSDIIAFGLAPAILVYQWWVFVDFGKIGWLLAFLYTATTALRLARFNSSLKISSDKGFFHGLPCPSAAAALASMVWCLYNADLESRAFSIALMVMMILVSYLMVSNVKYFSFKHINFKQQFPFFWGMVFIVGLVVIFLHPPIMLLIIFMGYIMFGIIWSLYQWWTCKN